MAFDLDVRERLDGSKYLHFDHVFFSDIHWGTKYSRAKAFCRVMPYIEAHNATFIGDIIDEWALSRKKSWNMPEWHRQGMAHVLRKGWQAIYVPGNHDDAFRDHMTRIPKIHPQVPNGQTYRGAIGKSIFNVDVVLESEYVDQRGRKFLVCHGDRFDPELYKASKGGVSLYDVGDWFVTQSSNLDVALNWTFGTEHISTLSFLKHKFKESAERRFKIKETAACYAYENGYDGVIMGHSHIYGFDRYQFDGGKEVLIINDGCVTDQGPECFVEDRWGTKAILKWNKTALRVVQEDGQVFEVPYNKLGMDDFAEEPEVFEDEYTQKVDRGLRVLYRKWPGSDVRSQRAKRDRAVGEIFQVPYCK